MPKAKSRAQQAYFWGVLIRQGKMTKAEARKRSVRGKAFSRLPKKVKTRRHRRRR